MTEVHLIRFAVNETPYCFRSFEQSVKIWNFSNKIDSRYFEHVAEPHIVGEYSKAMLLQFGSHIHRAWKLSLRSCAELRRVIV